MGRRGYADGAEFHGLRRGGWAELCYSELGVIVGGHFMWEQRRASATRTKAYESVANTRPRIYSDEAVEQRDDYVKVTSVVMHNVTSP